MTNPNAQPDSLWLEFEAAERARQIETEDAYKLIEVFNSDILNQIVGIDDASDASLAKSYVLPPSAKGQLYLRPDRRSEIYNSGEYDRVQKDGDPFSVVGELPERTQILIQGLIAEVGGTFNQIKGTPGTEVWYGNIKGKPVEINILRNLHRSRTNREVSYTLTRLTAKPRQENSAVTVKNEKPAEDVKPLLDRRPIMAIPPAEKLSPIEPRRSIGFKG